MNNKLAKRLRKAARQNQNLTNETNYIDGKNPEFKDINADGVTLKYKVSKGVPTVMTDSSSRNFYKFLKSKVHA